LQESLGTSFYGAVADGAANATIAQPAPTTKPAATQPAPAANPTSDAKKAVSKACSDQANAKGLHGKARKTFRSACKKSGGKAA
jgi:hypothetical protein